jgi:hypothetical protein
MGRKDRTDVFAPGPMYRYLTLAIACLVASPAFGQERQLAAFSEACLTGLAGFETVEAVAARYDAQLIDVDPPGAVLSPLTLPRADRRAWLGGQPDQKAVTDLSFGISVDAASDKPVVGCAVLGFVEGEPPADDILLGRFVNHRYVGKTKSTLGPDYRHWIVAEHAGTQAVFSVGRFRGSGDSEPYAFILAIDVVDPATMDRIGGP